MNRNATRNNVNIIEENHTTMKKNPTIHIAAAIAAIYLGLAGTLQAIPPPPTTPDASSTGIVLGAVVSGLVLLKWKLKTH